ncbi:NYN domain-containing protein [Pragia fontium]|uniref:TIGR00288 family protein n=1 Tax=Pragia fontium DSM 5563 = ATCC 49100 TaxID=1122977 RepID=A0AAJ4WAS2_9GAMM|nr:NYN domain-containing protein [Pragia fontium]SFC87550.1 TIGR00288 family protein [Pragia fontium DSM 5563 = ATCC 49100]VEJ56067.1 NYN domain [Pragia fontium]
MGNQNKIAVLIDVENVSCAVMPDVIKSLEKNKKPHLIRAYADWAKHNLNKWQETIVHYGIHPVYQPSYVSGKNSSDIALVIDAMDLMYSGQFNTFVLVTNDSDFVRLVIRLKEMGAYVIGISENKVTPAFKHACNQFVMSKKLSTEEMRILGIWPSEIKDWISISQLAKYWIAAGYPSQKGKYVKLFEKYPDTFLVQRDPKGAMMIKRRVDTL